MRRLTPFSRRQFGQGLGASLALTSAPRSLVAHDGPHPMTVRISRFAFVPDRVDIGPGGTVVWMNDDLAPHTATARDGSWDTGTLETGMSARLTFATPGDFPYFCAFHPHMLGLISVRTGRDG